MKTRIAAASALLVAASLTTTPSAEAAVGDSVTYTVNSDGPLHAVSYIDDSDQIQRVSNPDAPWSLTFAIKNPSTVLTVAAGGTAPGQQVSCEITVAGAVKDKQSGLGTADDPIQCSVLPF